MNLVVERLPGPSGAEPLRRLMALRDRPPIGETSALRPSWYSNNERR
ncbi:MAG: hypothetical protein ABI843_02515 [Dokdonella sp.]